MVGGCVFLEAVPVMASHVFPFARPDGRLVALGRLGADREILALETSGSSTARLMWPVAAFAGVCARALAALALLRRAGGASRARRARSRRSRASTPGRSSAPVTVAPLRRLAGRGARGVGRGRPSCAACCCSCPTSARPSSRSSGEVSTAPDGALELTLARGSLLLVRADEYRSSCASTSSATRLPAAATRLFDAGRRRAARAAVARRAARRSASAFVPRGVDRLPPAAVELHRRFATAARDAGLRLPRRAAVPDRAHLLALGGGVLGVDRDDRVLRAGAARRGPASQGRLSGVGAGVVAPDLVLAALAAVLLVRVRRASAPRPHLRARRVCVDCARCADAERERRLRPHSQRAPALRRRPLRARWPLLAFARALHRLSADRRDGAARLVRALPGATGPEVLRFYAARVPLLASRVVPMALLVGDRARGEPARGRGRADRHARLRHREPRALLPVLLHQPLVAPAYFAARQRGGAAHQRARRRAEADRDQGGRSTGELAEQQQGRASGGRSGSQRARGGALRHRSRRGARPHGLRDRTRTGCRRAATDAISARHIGNGVWRLVGSACASSSPGTSAQRVATRRFAQLGETLDAQGRHDAPLGPRARRRDRRDSRPAATTPRPSASTITRSSPSRSPAWCCPPCVLFFALTGPPSRARRRRCW